MPRLVQIVSDDGNGVALDVAEALWWFKLAAAQGFGVALNNVGVYQRRATVLLPTKQRRFAGTSAPLQRDGEKLQPM